MSDNTPQSLAPGAFVVHPEQPEWGLGQVQSVVGRRVTVNFEYAGKLLFDSNIVSLRVVDPNESGAATERD